MATERQDPTRQTPTSPDGEPTRAGAQRDAERRAGQQPTEREDEKRRKPPEVNPNTPGDDDDLNQPGQSGDKDRERSGATRTRNP